MIRRIFPLLLLLFPMAAVAQETPAASEETPAASEGAPAAEQAPPEKEQARWFFSATSKGEQGPVDTTELRELIKIKVVNGGTPLRQDGTQDAVYPGDVPELTDLIKWHFVLRGKKTGPVNTARLKKLVSLGVVDSKSKVWRPGMERWTPMAEVVELGGKAPPPQEPEPEPPEEEPDPRLARFVLSFGPHLGGSFFSNGGGMGMLTGGCRVSSYYLVSPYFHLGAQITWTFIDELDPQNSTYLGVDGLHDFAFGLTGQVGRQFSDRLWVGFGLDLGVSALRRANLVQASDVTVQFDVGAHLYTAPRAQLIYMFTHRNTRMGLSVSLSVPVLMGEVDFKFTRPNAGQVESHQGFEVWSGLSLNLELVLGVR